MEIIICMKFSTPLPAAGSLAAVETSRGAQHRFKKTRKSQEEFQGCLL